MRLNLLLVILGHIEIWTSHAAQCGYDQCDLGKKGYLNVHLVPHTHDDVGWVKTVDQYYYGTKNYIQKACVKCILDSVIRALNADSRRRFTYVEMAFFFRWWRDQTNHTRELVQQLVRDGRLQFALGGWTMADEATVHYADAVDQMTRGHDLLYKLFGQCGIPRVAWQIDPFGHARDHAELFRDAGFDALFFKRMDYREKAARKEARTLEILWDTRSFPNQSNSGLFTSMFYDSYHHPRGFCFDVRCSDEPIRDDPHSVGYNVEKRIGQFLDHVNKVSRAFATEHIMVLMGADFTYENATMNFNNMDKLIHHLNQRQAKGSKVHMFYSTPQCYTKAVNVEFTKLGTIERRVGDFFPYATGPSSYWTGYYTSRPAMKGYVKQASTLLTMCEQIHLLGDRIPRYNHPHDQSKEDVLIDDLRQAMGVMQHHDAVTGTEMQHVSDDYIYTLTKATKSCQKLIGKAIDILIPSLPSLTGTHDLPIFCDRLNISLCIATEGSKPYLNQNGQGGVYILVYNPNGWKLWSHWVRIPIYLDPTQYRRTSIKIQDMRLQNRQLGYQLVPISKRTINIPERHSKSDSANMELIFNAAGSGIPLPAIGFTMYQLTIDSRQPKMNRYLSQRKASSCPVTSVVSKTTRLSLEVLDGNQSDNPVSVIAEHLASGNLLKLQVDMMYYYGETGKGQKSGAYVFLPRGGDSLQRFPKPTYRYVRGACVNEVHLSYTDWATLIIRLHADGQLETEWTVGPIPDDHSREVILRYTVSGRGMKPSASGEFFTDSAGRRMIKRLRNQRPDWNISQPFHETQSVAGNYYPVINRLMLKGSSERLGNGKVLPAIGLVVYTDRAQGGSSLLDGQLELMIHRRLLKDEGLGVREPLREDGEDHKGLIVRGRHILRLDELSILEKEDPVSSRQLTKQPVLLFAPSQRTPIEQPIKAWSGLDIVIPPDLHLLSIVAWPLLSQPDGHRIGKRDQILIRLEHLLTENKSSSQFDRSSQQMTQLDVTNMIRGLRIVGASEVTLTAHQEITLAKSERLRWPTESIHRHVPHVRNHGESVILHIPAGEIITYILDYRPSVDND